MFATLATPLLSSSCGASPHVDRACCVAGCRPQEIVAHRTGDDAVPRGVFGNRHRLAVRAHSFHLGNLAVVRSGFRAWCRRDQIVGAGPTAGCRDSLRWCSRARCSSAPDMLRYNVRGYRDRWWSTAARSRAEQLRLVIVWVRARTRPDDVIASTVEPIDLPLHRAPGRAGNRLPRERLLPSAHGQSNRVIALRRILAGYRVDAVAINDVPDSLRAAVQIMMLGQDARAGGSRQLSLGLVFAPVAPPRISAQHPDH